MLNIGKTLWNARIWEDGTFSFGYVPFNMKEYEAIPEPPLYDGETSDMLRMCIETHGLDETLKYMRTHPEAYKTRTTYGELGLSDVPKSHSEKLNRGRAGITTHGKKLVRNAALRLERECGNFLLSFVTLTIPGISAEGALVVCENWGEIVRVFQQRLKRRLQSKGLPGEMVGCTEVQENRFAATNVVALHLHLVFQGRQFGMNWALTPTDIRGMWKDVLSPYLKGVEQELYWDACENVQRVRKSASGYLGKYMSKGIKACKQIVDVYPEIVLPKCWYICTNSLRARVKTFITLLTSDKSPDFETLCSIGDTEVCFYYIHPIVIEIDKGRFITVGYVGRLKPAILDSFRHSLKLEEFQIPF